jgi:SAM-dependent methyltransferase
VRGWLEQIKQCGVNLHYGSAVDFGCGVGRLSQALGKNFDRVTGVDISPTMIDVALRLNKHREKVQYLLNSHDDLTLLPDRSADFVLSFITLQHIRPHIAEKYIAEFFRIVRPGGVIYFQVPSHRRKDHLPPDAQEKPLPRSACQAAFDLAEPSGLVAEAGVPFQVAVRVRNASSTDWKQSVGFPINLGNHWLSSDGRRVLVHDDGRERFPPTLRPQEEAIFKLTVVPPAEAGQYTLDVDVVQEGVRWFTEAGSPTLRVPVRVAAPESRGPANARLEASTLSQHEEVLRGLIDAQYSPAPLFEMHGIHRDRIQALVRKHGGSILHIDEHVTEWFSYGYVIRAFAGPN